MSFNSINYFAQPRKNRIHQLSVKISLCCHIFSTEWNISPLKSKLVTRRWGSKLCHSISEYHCRIQPNFCQTNKQKLKKAHHLKMLDAIIPGSILLLCMLKKLFWYLICTKIGYSRMIYVQVPMSCISINHSVSILVKDSMCDIWKLQLVSVPIIWR